MFKPFYVLLTINNPHGEGNLIEIVCAKNNRNMIALYNYRRFNPWVKFVVLNEQQAYDLLEEIGGYGIGCYTHSDNIREHTDRWKLAKLKATTLNKRIKSFDPMGPVEVPNPAKFTLREKIMREILTVRFNNDSP